MNTGTPPFTVFDAASLAENRAGRLSDTQRRGMQNVLAFPYDSIWLGPVLVGIGLFLFVTGTAGPILPVGIFAPGLLASVWGVLSARHTRRAVLIGKVDSVTGFITNLPQYSGPGFLISIGRRRASQRDYIYVDGKGFRVAGALWSVAPASGHGRVFVLPTTDVAVNFEARSD